MKSKLFYLFLLVTTLVFSQQEASVWYFGVNAGIKFNIGGTVTALTDGQLVTGEGCATLSDSSGNLLFYTDGITVYNRNHQVMQNGTGLMGHGSSSQSATIVPLPGSTTMFYVFTLDYEAHSNGFRYSIIDMSLDSGLGGVTASKNVLLYTPSNEKLAIVKHANNTDFWVVTHGWNNNAFYSYLLTSSGLSATPVTSNVGVVVTGSTNNVWGYMKMSSDGNKLAVCNSLLDFELLDFNTTTGVVSNPIILNNSGFNYGAEFSPNNEILYLSVSKANDDRRVQQFDLTASDIAGSVQTIYNSTTTVPCALQLGPDGKIYIAKGYDAKLGVINNPNTLGVGCDIQMDAIDLAGKFCTSGLPAFNQSFFFAPAIQLTNTCVGQSASFQLQTSQTITSATWNFGDGSTSNSISPTHIYTAPGTYTVSVVATTSQGTGTKTREIVIYPQPVLSATIVSLKQCDDNQDGFSPFNLQEAIPLLTPSSSGLTFSFFETAAEAQNNSNPIPNTITYTNQIVNNDTVFVRVENTNGCYKVAQLDLVVSTTQIQASFMRTFTVCDDVVSGSTTDGIATFNFSSADAQIRALFPVGQLLDITYYRNVSDALAEQNAIANTSSYTNTDYPYSQNIYVRVDSQLNNECLGLGHHITLNVERIPIAQPQTVRHCDDNQDGKYAFDTSNLQANLLNGLTNVMVTYFDQNNNPLSSPLPNPFITASQTLRVVVTNNTTAACSYETTVNFIVDDLPETFPIPTNLTTVCDDEADPVNQDGVYPFNTTTFQSAILGGQTGMIVNYYDANNNPLASPLPNPFVSATQNIRVEVVNPVNNSCMASIMIPLIVKPVPVINLIGDELICSDNPNFIKVVNAGLIDTTTVNNFTYTWYFNNNVIPNQNSYSLTVNQEGIYTVEVKNIDSCTRTRTITVTASNIATITNIEVTDLSSNNSIVVNVSGQGNYVYSLDNINFQESNVFTGLEAGVYNVYVKDLFGCGTTPPKEVSILGIPNFFTPNGDGYNDYWNINGVGASYGTTTTIFIFDRYGKLLKQVSPHSQGWDGTYNGQPVPSDDYWYAIEFQEERIIKGHFALKR